MDWFQGKITSENPINLHIFTGKIDGLLGKSMVYWENRWFSVIFSLKNKSIDPLTAGCLPPPAFFHCFSTGQRSARDGPGDVRGRDGSEDARSHVRSALSADDGMMGWWDDELWKIISFQYKNQDLSRFINNVDNIYQHWSTILITFINIYQHVSTFINMYQHLSTISMAN